VKLKAMNSLKKWGITVLAAVFINTAAQSQPLTDTITITNFKVYEKDAKQVVEWNSAVAAATTSWWQVQGSTNGTTFTTLAIVLGDDPREQGTYRYAAKIGKSKTAIKYYRLCYMGTGGTTQLSEIIQPAK
jgi:hypothetical protein